jgi:acyl dehydratase
MIGQAATEVGTELAGDDHRVTMEDMILFADEGVKDIHTDEEIARAAGLPAPVAPGAQLMAYIHEMLRREYGFDSVSGTVLDVRFRALVLAGDTVTASGMVTRSEGLRIDLDVRCQNQRGEQVVAGTAQVSVAPA